MSKKEKKPKKQKKPFKTGTVVIWDHKNFNPEFWENLSEEDRLKYYAPLGYGKKKPPLFVYLCEILKDDGFSSGHCVLINMDTKKIESMRHTAEFRKATEDEF